MEGTTRCLREKKEKRVGGSLGVVLRAAWCCVRNPHATSMRPHRDCCCCCAVLVPLLAMHVPLVASFYPCAGAPKGEFCSGRGTCDYETGVCACADGYTGTACQQIEALA